MTGQVVQGQWAKGKNAAVVALVAVIIVAVFGGVIWWVVSLLPGPNYRVQAVHRPGNPFTSVTITSNDDLAGSDYQEITAKVWEKYGAVRVAWQCENGASRGRASQSSAGDYAGTQTGVRC